MNEERKKALTLLKTAKGQIQASIDMIENDRYCVDISTQINAVHGLLKKSNLLILEQHIHHCVREAIEDGRGDEKIDEVMGLLSKMTKS